MAVSPIARNKAFEVIEEGIVVSSSRGRVVDMNPAGTALLEKLLASLTAVERVDLAGRQTRRYTMQKSRAKTVTASSADRACKGWYLS
jgi:hypothetical protein